jgi:hypothetical protein
MRILELGCSRWLKWQVVLCKQESNWPRTVKHAVLARKENRQMIGQRQQSPDSG